MSEDQAPKIDQGGSDKTVLSVLVGPEELEELRNRSERAQAVLDSARGLVVSDELTLQVANEMQAGAKDALRQLKDRRDYVREPIKLALARLDLQYASPMKVLTEAITILARSASDYLVRRDRAIALENRRRQEEADRVQREEEARRREDARKVVEEEAIKAGNFTPEEAREIAVETAKDLPPAPPQSSPVPALTAPRSFLTEKGRVTYRDDWDFDVVDVWAVPREYLRVEVKRKEVKEFLSRTGGASIPGLNVRRIKVSTHHS